MTASTLTMCICADEWNVVGDQCFEYFETPSSWDDAQSSCEAEGGHLASIMSSAEQEEILGLAGNPPTWIGARATTSLDPISTGSASSYSSTDLVTKSPLSNSLSIISLTVSDSLAPDID